MPYLLHTDVLLFVGKTAPPQAAVIPYKFGITEG